MRMLAKAHHALIQGWGVGFFVDPPEYTTFRAVDLGGGQWATEATLNGNGHNFLWHVGITIPASTDKIVWATARIKSDAGGVGSMNGVFQNDPGRPPGAFYPDGQWRWVQGAVRTSDRTAPLWFWLDPPGAHTGKKVLITDLTIWDEPWPTAWDGVAWQPNVKGWNGVDWVGARVWDGARWAGTPESGQDDTWSPWMLVGDGPATGNPMPTCAWFAPGVTHYDGGAHHQVYWRYSPDGRMVHYKGLARNAGASAIPYNGPLIYAWIDPAVLPKPTTQSMGPGLNSMDETALWHGAFMRYDVVPDEFQHHRLVSCKYRSPDFAIQPGEWFDIDVLVNIGSDV